MTSSSLWAGAGGGGDAVEQPPSSPVASTAAAAAEEVAAAADTADVDRTRPTIFISPAAAAAFRQCRGRKASVSTHRSCQVWRREA